MLRALKLLVAALLFGSVWGVAHAQSGAWTVSEVSGRVTIRDGSEVETASRGARVDAGEIIETGPASRAVVVRGKDFVTVSPSSRLRIPAVETREAGIFDVLQEWGNAIFQIEKKPDPHFSVGTPYLAAVVKGTTFSITVSDEGASLQVTEGAVETSTTDGGARELIRPGIVAIVAAGDPHRLTVQGQETRVIDSPQRPAAGAGGPDAQSSTDSRQSNGGQVPAADAGPQFAFVSEAIAPALTPGAQMIAEPVTAAAVDLGQLTRGLVGGTTASQVSSAQAASVRDAVRGPQFAGQPGNGSGGPGNGNDPGNGNGNGGSENGNGGQGGNDPGNGNGNGNGNGGPNGNDPGNGNNGNGNGNGGSNGNDPGNGNGNNGNGNGNGGPNGNDPGNGNGNGNSGPGNANGNGNS